MRIGRRASRREQNPEESWIPERRENAFHRQRLSDHAPVTRAKCDQLVPNWNSMGIPVTTPITKLMPKILPEKRAALIVELIVAAANASVFRIRISGASPIVSCGKEIMKRDRKGKMQPVHQEGVIHGACRFDTRLPCADSSVPYVGEGTAIMLQPIACCPVDGPMSVCVLFPGSKAAREPGRAQPSDRQPLSHHAAKVRQHSFLLSTDPASAQRSSQTVTGSQLSLRHE